MLTSAPQVFGRYTVVELSHTRRRSKSESGVRVKNSDTLFKLSDTIEVSESSARVARREA